MKPVVPRTASSRLAPGGGGGSDGVSTRFPKRACGPSLRGAWIGCRKRVLPGVKGVLTGPPAQDGCRASAPRAGLDENKSDGNTPSRGVRSMSGVGVWEGCFCDFHWRARA